LFPLEYQAVGAGKGAASAFFMNRQGHRPDRRSGQQRPAAGSPGAPQPMETPMFRKTILALAVTAAAAFGASTMAVGTASAHGHGHGHGFHGGFHHGSHFGHGYGFGWWGVGYAPVVDCYLVRKPIFLRHSRRIVGYRTVRVCD
jgi:hypothetical protein